MDYLKRLRSALVILGMAAALAGCPEEKVSNFIYAFNSKQIPVGLSDTVDIILYEAVQEESLYVVLSNNSNSAVLQATYNTQVDTQITIKFKKGENKKTVNLKALKPGDANLTFKIRDTDKWAILNVKVVPVNYGDGQWDSGPLPDYAGMEAGADTGTFDTGTSDTSTGDSSSTTPEASTGDTSTTTADTGAGG